MQLDGNLLQKVLDEARWATVRRYTQVIHCLESKCFPAFDLRLALEAVPQPLCSQQQDPYLNNEQRRKALGNSALSPLPANTSIPCYGSVIGAKAITTKPPTIADFLRRMSSCLPVLPILATIGFQE